MVVPVEVLAGVAALHPLQRGHRAVEPRDRLRVADDPQPLGHDRAPHVRADVGREVGGLRLPSALTKSAGRPVFSSVIATNDAHVPSA
jgi:hypothetical protein